MPMQVRVDLKALAQRMEKVLVEVLEDMDKAANRRREPRGDQSPRALEIRGCLSAMKTWALQEQARQVEVENQLAR